MTEYLKKQILLRPEKSGRLEKWAIELGKHATNYRSHTRIKAQSLADLLVEIPDTLKNIPTVLPIDPSEVEASRDV